MGDDIPVRYALLIFKIIKSNYGLHTTMNICIVKTIPFVLEETILIIGQTDKKYIYF